MYNFQFDFLSQDQNMILSESINYLFGDEMSRLRNENRALADRLRSAEKNSAFLSERNETLSNQAQGACKEADRLNGELCLIRRELVDSHRANVTLRESLEKEREQVVHLSGPRPADADAEELRSQNEIMTGVIERLKDELRTYSDFAKRIVRTAETAPERALEDEKA